MGDGRPEWLVYDVLISFVTICVRKRGRFPATVHIHRSEHLEFTRACYTISHERQAFTSHFNWLSMLIIISASGTKWTLEEIMRLVDLSVAVCVCLSVYTNTQPAGTVAPSCETSTLAEICALTSALAHLLGWISWISLFEQAASPDVGVSVREYAAAAMHGC